MDVSRFVTTAYASPEQAQRSPTDSRSDLYSVGCVLYELLTGRPPFVGEAQDVLFERLVDEPKAPSAHNPEVSPDLDAVVLRSLRRDPADRHPSAEAMKDDLEGVIRSRRAPAAPLGGASRRPGRRQCGLAGGEGAPTRPSGSSAQDGSPDERRGCRPAAPSPASVSSTSADRTRWTAPPWP